MEITVSMGRQDGTFKAGAGDTDEHGAICCGLCFSSLYIAPDLAKNHTLGQDVTRDLLLYLLKQGCLCAAQSAVPFAQLL